MGDVEPAMGEIEPKRLHHREAEFALLFNRERALDRFGRAPGVAAFLRIECLGHEIDEEGFEFFENRGDIGNAVAGVELLHQRVIGGQPEHIGAHLRFLAG